MQSGQPAHAFWDCTWREVDIILKASYRRDSHLAWLSAKYAAFAYHEPNKIPDSLAVEKPNPAPMREADAIAARAILIGWASRSAAHG